MIVTVSHIAHLLWVLFILSGGFAAGMVAWRTFKLRKRHRVFHYFGMVMTTLFLATLNSSWTIITLLHDRGLLLFDGLSFADYRNLLFQTLLAVALWALALYLGSKLNGSFGK